MSSLKRPIVTISGQKIFIDEIRPDQIFLGDIAHALGRIPRFNGHTIAPYTVAQHSVMCSWVVQPSLKMAALLHDAAEAYIGDCISPLKDAVPQIRELEHKIEVAIAERFGLSMLQLKSPEVKYADNRCFNTEVTYLLTKKQRERLGLVEPDLYPVIPNVKLGSRRDSSGWFVNRYLELGGNCELLFPASSSPARNIAGGT